jgi:hypothetical protein
MGAHSVIFNGLGPRGTYRIGDKVFKDGDIASVSDNNYVILLNDLHFAVDATPENITKVQRLVESAKQKRKEVAEKMELKLSKGGTN